MKPTDLPFQFLQEITNEFSDERKLGSGGYGQVYKGVDKNGKAIAVKKFYDMPGLDDMQFMNELNSLMRVRHQNIVRLVGYCREERHTHVEHNGEYVFCKIIYRVLCLEFLEGGSLDKHLYDESRGHDWGTRYKIIKGICEGLNYLHGAKNILHLDLKPANILLDKNMVPKIADFGLSRLFGETHTHATKSCIGTELYMPPEYFQKRQISPDKYDVFSLGVIIIQIMAGREGYSKYADMSSPQQFIELVHKNWRDRIEATSMNASTEEECQQVKRCIELALNCVETDRNKRPTIKNITRELRRTETNGSASLKGQARIAKIGQWGGVGGGNDDIEVAPCRLISLIICSDEVIYSLEFSYYDHDGRQHTAGPWGGHGPRRHGNYRHVINLDPTEFVTEVYGTIGPFDSAPAGVIKSLTVITNTGRYGPYGEVQGTPFQIPVRSNGSIVGFFARAGWYIDAFGIYVNPKQEMELDLLTHEEAGLVKIGPWGGKGGNVHDIEVAPHRLESMTICSGTVIDSLVFSYRDRDGQQHTADPRGGPAGGSAHTDTIQLGRSEFLTGVYGTMGPFAHASADVVTSLTLVTNARRYGPFGEGGGTPFQIPMWCKGSIVGFFGRAESCVHAIGVYANPDQEAMEEELVCSREPGLAKVGPWGGDGGNARDINTNVQPHRLESVTISYGAVIDSLSFSYIDFNGHNHTVGPWGGPGGNAYTIRFKPLELLQGVSGTIGPFGELPNVITSLTFATNHCCAYGPFGQGGGTPFSIPAERDGCIVGFFGHAGSYLEAIGVYVHRY